jgi:hypothetical protein
MKPVDGEAEALLGEGVLDKRRIPTPDTDNAEVRGIPIPRRVV